MFQQWEIDRIQLLRCPLDGMCMGVCVCLKFSKLCIRLIIPHTLTTHTRTHIGCPFQWFVVARTCITLRSHILTHTHIQAQANTNKLLDTTSDSTRGRCVRQCVYVCSRFINNYSHGAERDAGRGTGMRAHVIIIVVVVVRAHNWSA